MKNIFLVIQILSSALLVFLVAIQSSGNSLNRSISSSVITKFGKRGIERLIMKLTVILIVTVISVSILLLVLP